MSCSKAARLGLPPTTTCRSSIATTPERLPDGRTTPRPTLRLPVRPLRVTSSLSPDIDAPAYRAKFAAEIGDGITAYFGEHDLPTGSRFLQVSIPSLLAPTILGATGADLEAHLDGWPGPGAVNALVDRARPKGRELVTDGDKTWLEDKTSAGPGRWFPDVGVEIAAALQVVLRKSLTVSSPGTRAPPWPSASLRKKRPGNRSS